MKLHFRRYLQITASALALVSMVWVHASAQDQTYSRKAASKPLPDGGPAPRAADGHPDLTGHWYVGLLGKEDATLLSGGVGNSDPSVRPFDPKVTPEEQPSFQPWAAEKIKQLTASARATGGNYDKLPKAQRIALLNNEILHLSQNCMPHGVPAMFLEPGHGMELVQTSGLLVQLMELNHDFRLVPTDGRPHTKDPDPAFAGEGIGHWEGDTLVIDTIGLDERVGVMQQWSFHSDQEHVIERISRPSLNYLNYQVTVDDPKVLTKPWKSVVHHFSLSHEPMLEWYCGVNSHDDEDLAFLRQELKKVQEEK
jgi:hypothetical protein